MGNNFWKRLFNKLDREGKLKYLSDYKYLKIAYKVKLNKKLNLKNPITYNEKLQWLKLNDRNPLYNKLVDKFEVKAYVSDKIGENYVIPLIGVWDNFDDVNMNDLPNQFVMKTTHNSGGVVICKDKAKNIYYNKNGTKISKDEAVQLLMRSIKINYYYNGREWPYKNVKPRIIAENYIEGKIEDYKMICCDGEVKCIYIESGRGTNLTCDFYDTNFQKLPITQVNPNSNIQHIPPKNLDKIKTLAGKLSMGIPQVRVDFMVVNNQVFFGEMTFYNWCGYGKFEPASWDKTFGDWIDLSKAYSNKE